MEKVVSAVVLCAGRGQRSGLDYNKIFYYFGTKTVLEMTLDNFVGSCVSDIVLVVAPSDMDRVKEIVGSKYNVRLCEGGDTRFMSVKNGLGAVGACDIVVIHDGARPFASPALIDACVRDAEVFGSGIAAVKSTDTLHVARDGFFIGNLDRDCVYNVQTPQAFDSEKICAAYACFDGTATDDSEVFRRAGFAPRICEGSYDNVKITSPSDLYGIRGGNLRVGNGFDVHRLVTGRRLVIGGVDIPFEKGLLGHSDADVLIHAIMDALLSAAGLADIGVFFPNNDPKYSGISSTALLEQVLSLIITAGFAIKNISSVVIAEKPKLATFIPKMREIIASALKIPTASINISATTAETLGMVGEEKGIAASAVCLLEKL